MTDMWDIARHVEENPDDFPERWNLAKRLYMAWEYRLALEHLQVLRNGWEPRINVSRYLAGTYYRLGRYDEAVNELEAAIGSWPEEVPLYQQLARVLEVSGKRIAAAKTWKRVKELDPNHPLAGAAAQRLLEEEDAQHEVAEPGLQDSDAGIDLSPGQACPNCSAQNSDEFDRCWQCHAPLPFGGKTAGQPKAGAAPAPEPGIDPEFAGKTLTIAALLLLAVGAGLSIQMAAASLQKGVPVLSMADVYNREMAITRIVLGLGSFLLWPWVMRTAVSLFAGAASPSPPLAMVTGLATAAIAYNATWLPLSQAPLIVLLPLVASLAACLILFGLSPARALGAWAFQAAIMALITIAGFTAIESVQTGVFFNPITEIPAIRAYVKTIDDAGGTLSGLVPQETSPFEQGVAWTSTGSRWIDKRAGDTLFEVKTDEHGKELMFELADSGRTRVYESVVSKPWTTTYPVVPGKIYTLHVSGKDGAPVRVKVTGLFLPKWR